MQGTQQATPPGVEVQRTPILGLQVVKYRVMDTDPRGPFMIPLELAAMEPAGLTLSSIRQLNISVSYTTGTTRGLHVSSSAKYCFAPLPGHRFWNPVVDLRDPDSQTYGQWEAIELAPGTAVYLPPGYGNGLQAMEPGSVYMYLLDSDFVAADERVVWLRDSFIGIEWPMSPVYLSAKDRSAPTLGEYTEELRSRLN